MWARWQLAGIFGPNVPLYNSRWDLLEASAALASQDGLWLEFGVYQGESINLLARRRGGQVFGFDSFEGLPSGWAQLHKKGEYSVFAQLPKVEANVTLVKGWFEESLPPFLRALGPYTTSFLHVDSDLYESARFVLGALGESISRGTVIVFDEFMGILPDDESRAFREFLELHPHGFRYLGCGPTGSVALVITT
jgi:hypothetical protein